MATDTTDQTGPGRPGISREQVHEAVDTWVARTGRLPSSRQLRTALGDTGSLTTINRHLQAIKAERLMGGEKPDAESAEAITLKAMSAALKVLSAEASDAAEAIHQARRARGR